ncbi:MAG: hypothetical protein WBK55_06190 [Alphaproteobacteria bacterium]
MTRFLAWVLIVVLSAAAPQVAAAQDGDPEAQILPLQEITPNASFREEAKEAPRKVPPRAPNDYVSLPQYETLVRNAIRARPKNFDFGALRSYYTLVPQYDPLGDTARREILDLAYKIQNDPDPAVRKDAFDKYGALVSAHLANIDVISQALVLSREDKIFGDPKFFDYMRSGLLRNIVTSGDGRSLVGAYDAVTLGEETALLKALRLRLLRSEPRESGGVYYNMLEVQAGDAYDPYWIFVDVTKPMVFLERQRQNAENVFAIPRQ